jgi:hypothetical protein
MHEVRRHHAEQVRAVGDQRARMLVRVVFHPARDSEHTLRRLGINLGMIVDGPRDGHFRNTQLASDVG